MASESTANVLFCKEFLRASARLGSGRLSRFSEYALFHVEHRWLLRKEVRLSIERGRYHLAAQSNDATH